MNEKKRVNIKINRPINDVGELKNVLVDMGYKNIYLTDEDVKKLLITGVLKKETDTHLLDINLCLLDTSDFSLSLGSLDSDDGGIFGFDVFIDNLITTDMNGRGDELVMTFVINDKVIFDTEEDDIPMTVHECMEYLSDFMVNERINSIIIMIPNLSDVSILDNDSERIEIDVKMFHCYRKDEDIDTDGINDSDE